LRPYLRELPGDPRVIEANRLLWWFILNLLVLPRRPARSAKLYQRGSAIASPAQDDVIEAVLPCRGAWDPPWKCQPPARGPPARASPELDSLEPNEPRPGFDDYAVDPPGADDGG
jgi:hypothetical protein